MKLNSVYFDRALTYWNSLAPRERLVLGSGLVIAAVLLLYGLLWAPLRNDINRLRVEVPREQQQLQWMRAQAGRIQQLRAAAPTALPGGGLLSFVEQSAQTHGIRANIKRIEPEGSNAVRLAIDSVGFNSLVEWLANLQKQGGVRVDNAQLEPLPTPGLANARLLLRGPGS
ncbi:MAG: type II secretion system protein GspM [Sulfurifustaceae bacterium]